MKKLFTVLVIVIFIAVLAGCSGGSTEEDTSKNPEAASDTSTSTTAPTTTTPTPTTTGTTTGTTAQTKELPRKIEYTDGTLPKDLEHVIENGVPVMVGFYEDGDRVSERLKDQVAQVAADYNGLMEYYEYTSLDDTSVTKLSLSLGVGYLPHISIIDRSKNIVFEKSGFLEANYLDTALYKAIYDNKKE